MESSKTRSRKSHKEPDAYRHLYQGYIEVSVLKRALKNALKSVLKSIPKSVLKSILKSTIKILLESIFLEEPKKC